MKLVGEEDKHTMMGQEDVLRCTQRILDSLVLIQEAKLITFPVEDREGLYIQRVRLEGARQLSRDFGRVLGELKK